MLKVSEEYLFTRLVEINEIIHENFPFHYYDLMDGNGDADTSDAFFQVATMGELTFG